MAFTGLLKCLIKFWHNCGSTALITGIIPTSSSGIATWKIMVPDEEAGQN